ncbi:MULTISPECIES: TetR-like C-terminal domain-containing protein [Paenibacillus]|uniref:TetR-like C-terminal domain-containing protein n=1 Tax=Paenibacillus TaxID=44249 RepID=UPI002FE1122D
MSNSQLTKKALAAALKNQMNTTPLSKITVKHLVENCGLNRQTFYYHFQDIYELLGWIYQTEAVDTIAAYRSYDTWPQGLLKIFKYIETNRSFCLNTLHSLARDHLDTYLFAVTNRLIMGVVQEVSRNKQVSDEDKKFMANFYTLAFTGLVIQWMGEGMVTEPELIIERLTRLMEGNFERALQRYENSHR